MAHKCATKNKPNKVFHGNASYAKTGQLLELPGSIYPARCQQFRYPNETISQEDRKECNKQGIRNEVGPLDQKLEHRYCKRKNSRNK